MPGSRKQGTRHYKMFQHRFRYLNTDYFNPCEPRGRALVTWTRGTSRIPTQKILLPEIRSEIVPEVGSEIIPEVRSEIIPQVRSEIVPEIVPEVVFEAPNSEELPPVCFAMESSSSSEQSTLSPISQEYLDGSKCYTRNRYIPADIANLLLNKVSSVKRYQQEFLKYGTSTSLELDTELFAQSIIPGRFGLLVPDPENLRFEVQNQIRALIKKRLVLEADQKRLRLQRLMEQIS